MLFGILKNDAKCFYKKGQLNLMATLSKQKFKQDEDKKTIQIKAYLHGQIPDMLVKNTPIWSIL